jgi:hypothetical protein
MDARFLRRCRLVGFSEAGVKLTVCYITARREPHLQWTLDDLVVQRKDGDSISLVVIDFYGRSQDQLGIEARHALEHTIIDKPKPTPWQGEHRVTRDHWWAKSSAANTALALAPTDYLAFLDDRCHLGPKWLATVRRGYEKRESVLLGTYSKVEDGHIGHDGRRAHSPRGLIGCPNNWLYGSVFALPLAWALKIGGFEEALDGMSFEDVIFGMMLSNAGFRCDFIPDLEVVQDRRGGRFDSHANAFKRTDKGPEPADLNNPYPPWDKSHEAIRCFGSRSHVDTAYTSCLELRHVVLMKFSIRS